MNDFSTIDTAALDTIHGGSKGKLIKKGVEYAGRAARWGWNEVIKPGLIWAGVDSLADKAGGQQQP